MFTPNSVCCLDGIHVDYKIKLDSALERRNVNELLELLKEANNAEEDLFELTRHAQKDVMRMLFEGLKSEQTHDISAIIIAKICARDSNLLLDVCRLLEEKNPALVAGAAAVITNTCSRSPESCKKLPNWIVGRLVDILKMRQQEVFVDRRRWSRARAIEALGVMGDSAAIPALVSALEDKDLIVVMHARYALARMPDSAKVVDAILRFLSSESRIAPIVNALWILERITLSSPEGQMAQLKKAVPILTGLISKSSDPEVLYRGMRALANIDKEKGVESISALLYKDFGVKSERIEHFTVRNLVRLAKTNCPAAEHALRAFVEHEERLPENKRSPIYREAKSALEMLEAEEKL